MGYPNREFKPGGGRSFGGRNFGGDRDINRPQMHQAVCSTCGKDCEIPFRPTGDRPVYCRDCFAKNRSHEGDRSFGRDNRDNRESPRPEFKRFNEDRSIPSPRNNNELDAINSKLDQILKILNTNTPQAPIPTETTTPEVIVKKKRISKKADIKTPEETSI